MNTDQYFSPGEKVMRVAYADTLGLPVTRKAVAQADFGRVLCVEFCWEGPVGNLVMFVGIPLPVPHGCIGGFHAACFRRVSEIQLCVRAAKRLSSPVETPAETQNV